jgi:5'-nucleotidase
MYALVCSVQKFYHLLFSFQMRILISNDDGYFSPGLACLVQHLSQVADVVVVAPEQDRSGASNSLTLDRPLKLRKAASGFYYVNGTPTDCVHLAVTGMLDYQPDMVISGINAGANMGDDTIYSGTVAAATEGFLLGIPALAISLVGHDLQNYDTAAKVACDLVQRFAGRTHEKPWLLNVNVPDVPYEQLQGVQVTRLGKRHKAEPVIKAASPSGETVYWVGPAGRAQDAGEGTDFNALAQKRVSLTPLQIDLTQYGQMDAVKAWLGREQE